MSHSKHFLVLLQFIFLSVFSASAQNESSAILQKSVSANDWFMKQWPDPTKDTFVRNKIRPSSLWTRAVYYEGLMALQAVSPQQRYLDYTLQWCNYHKWTPRNGVKTHDADDYCCSQTYIDMYRMGAEGATLKYVIENAELIIARGDESNPDWWWIDAIQMGMPVFQKLAKTTGDARYAEKAWAMYEYTRNQQDGGMRNPKDGLWWRDKDFNPPYRSPGDKDCYWSRGDGWVVAALVRVLDEMETTDKHYGDYLYDLTTMLESLIPLQREDGFWNCSLADPSDFGGPEVTGTSLFLYGMAWCVNQGYLPKAKFMPVMEKAWKAMASSVHEDGMLGWQQGTGKQPSDSQPVTFDKLPDFDDYGVGCFLLGATEFYKLKLAEEKASNKAQASAFTLGRWPAPTPEAKPGIRWWWLGSAVSEEGLRSNLSQMASHGIGSVEITPLYGVKGNEKNNIPFLTDKWMEMLSFTQLEAGKHGMRVEMNCGTGWPFGGPEVPLEEAASKLIVVDSLLDVQKAKAYVNLNGPLSNKNASISVLAAPKKEEMYCTLIAQRSFKSNVKGKVRVIALYQSRTRQKVKRAAPGGEGWVIDHFDADAVKHYLSRFDKAFKESGVSFPTTFFNDSYEVYGADWTPSLLKEFKARRGFDLLDRLPQFVDGDATVISDYRETLSDLLLQNFTRQWVDWSHSHGVQVRNQAHGSPANLIDVYASVDVPEIEGFGLSEFHIKGLRRDPGFTKKNDSDLSMLKYAPSAAHVTGKPLASSETFTWLTEHFRTSLSQMKPDLDLMFCSGVNHMFFHGACYSPDDDPWPGWRFYASVDMSPTNTIWRDAPELTRYIERCQSWLQWGQPDNDFLVLLPVREMWKDNTKSRLMMFDIHSMQKKAPQFIKSILQIDSLGYDCDYISEQLLLDTKYMNGMLQTSAGTRYRGLVIPCNKTSLSKKVLQHIENLRKKGAHIIYNIEAGELAKAAKAEEMKTRFGLKMIRRITPDADGQCSGNSHHYFMANLTPNDVNAPVALAVEGKTAYWFNPLNDEVVPATFNAKGEVQVDLRSGESRILTVTSASTTTQNNGVQRASYTAVSFTTEPWKLHFIESQPVVTDTFQLARLQTWESFGNDSVKELMGTGVYETQLIIKEDVSAYSRFRMDLGDVRESARLYINDVYVGTAWCIPMTLDFKGILHKGANKVRIEVTNLPANRIAAYDRRGIKWRKFEEINVVNLNYENTLYSNWTPVPSGLNSNIRLFKCNN